MESNLSRVPYHQMKKKIHYARLIPFEYLTIFIALISFYIKTLTLLFCQLQYNICRN